MPYFFIRFHIVTRLTPRNFGGFRLIALCSAQDLDQLIPVFIAGRVLFAGEFPGTITANDALGQMLDANAAALAQHERISRWRCEAPGTLPGPFVTGEGLEGFGGQARIFLPVLTALRRIKLWAIRGISSERLRKGGQVSGKTLMRKNRSSLKRPCRIKLSRSLCVAVMIRTSHGNRPVVTNAFDTPLLQHTQQLDLDGRWNVAHLIEKDRASWAASKRPTRVRSAPV